jgi:hypothetical protein
LDIQNNIYKVCAGHHYCKNELKKNLTNELKWINLDGFQLCKSMWTVLSYGRGNQISDVHEIARPNGLQELHLSLQDFFCSYLIFGNKWSLLQMRNNFFCSLTPKIPGPFLPISTSKMLKFLKKSQKKLKN